VGDAPLAPAAVGARFDAQDDEAARLRAELASAVEELHEKDDVIIRMLKVLEDIANSGCTVCWSSDWARDELARLGWGR
jgi:hypothetical protein